MDPIANGAAVSEATSGWLAKHTGKTALLILAVLILVSLGRSADTKFTYDEYVTYRIAALPSAGDVWRFFADGLDTTGPLSALIAHTTGRSVLCSELAMRLPFSLIALGFGLECSDSCGGVIPQDLPWRRCLCRWKCRRLPSFWFRPGRIRLCLAAPGWRYGSGSRRQRTVGDRGARLGCGLCWHWR